MTKNEVTVLLNSLADAWRRRDYTEAAHHFAENVQYADPLRYSFSGRTQLRAFFEADEGYPQNTAWHMILFDEETQVCAAEYTYEGTHRYHGVVLIRFQNGEIVSWREYQHIDNRDWNQFISGTS